MNQVRIKKKRERDQARRIRFILYLGICVGALLTIRAFASLIAPGVFTLKHFLFFSIGSIPLCALMVSVVERFGSGLGGLLSGWTSRRRSLRETLGADLDKARYSKREGRLKEALSIIDGVLDRDPEFPDALFLKAQILGKDVRRAGEAKACLRKVRQLVPKDEALHRWASSYYDELIAAEKREYTHALQDKK